MSNTGLRFPIAATIGGENQNSAIFPSKLVGNHEQTPMKRPFNDTTNKSAENVPQSCTPIIKGEKSKTMVEPGKIDTDYLSFHYPKNNDCFCAGSHRTTEGFSEMLNPIIDMIYENFRIPEEVACSPHDDTMEFVPMPEFEFTYPEAHPFAYSLLLEKLDRVDDGGQDELNTSILSVPEFSDFPDTSLEEEDAWL